MTTIKLICNDQKFTVVQKPLIASGDVGNVILHVDFCAKWTGYSKTAVFYRDDNKDKVYHVLLDSNNDCVVPWEVLSAEGILHLGVFGVSGNLRKTTEMIKYQIKTGAYREGAAPPDPTPEIYDQIVQVATDARALAENARALAENAKSDAVAAGSAAGTKAANVAVEAEATRAKAAEKVNADAIAAESARAEEVEAGKASVEDLNAVSNVANAAMPKTGGTFTGKVNVPSVSAADTRLRNCYVVDSAGNMVSSMQIWFKRKV